MGNSKSLFIELRNGTPYNPLYGGDTLSGVLHANITEVVTIGQNGICLSLVGEEKVHWTTSSTDSDGKSSTTHHYRSANIAGFPIQIYLLRPDQVGRPWQGNFSFPFSIVLPKRIPGTFHHHYHGTGTAKIQYILSARIHIQGGMNIDKRFKTEVIVSSRPQVPLVSKEDAPSIFVKEHEAVVTCCCVSRGNIRFDGVVQGNFFEKGEQATLNGIVYNESSVTIESVTFGLRRYLEVQRASPGITSLASAAIGRIPPRSSKEINIPIIVPNFEKHLYAFEGQVLSCRYQLFWTINAGLFSQGISGSENVIILERGSLQDLENPIHYVVMEPRGAAYRNSPTRGDLTNLVAVQNTLISVKQFDQNWIQANENGLWLPICLDGNPVLQRVQVVEERKQASEALSPPPFMEADVYQGEMCENVDKAPIEAPPGWNPEVFDECTYNPNQEGVPTTDSSKS